MADDDVLKIITTDGGSSAEALEMRAAAGSETARRKGFLVSPTPQRRASPRRAGKRRASATTPHASTPHGAVKAEDVEHAVAFDIQVHPETPSDVPEAAVPPTIVVVDDLPSRYPDAMLLTASRTQVEGCTMAWKGKAISSQDQFDAVFKEWNAGRATRRADVVQAQLTRARRMLLDGDANAGDQLEVLDDLWALAEWPSMHPKIIAECLRAVLTCMTQVHTDLQVRGRCMGLVYTLLTQRANLEAMLKKKTVKAMVRLLHIIAHRAATLHNHNIVAMMALSSMKDAAVRAVIDAHVTAVREDARAAVAAAEAEAAAASKSAAGAAPGTPRSTAAPDDTATPRGAAQVDDDGASIADSAMSTPRSVGGARGSLSGATPAQHKITADPVTGVVTTVEDMNTDFAKLFSQGDSALKTLLQQVHQLALLLDFVSGSMLWLAMSEMGRSALVRITDRAVEALPDAITTTHVVREGTEKAVLIALSLRKEQLRKRAAVREHIKNRTRPGMVRRLPTGGSARNLKAAAGSSRRLLKSTLRGATSFRGLGSVSSSPSGGAGNASPSSAASTPAGTPPAKKVDPDDDSGAVIKRLRSHAGDLSDAAFVRILSSACSRFTLVLCTLLSARDTGEKALGSLMRHTFPDEDDVDEDSDSDDAGATPFMTPAASRSQTPRAGAASVREDIEALGDAGIDDEEIGTAWHPYDWVQITLDIAAQKVKERTVTAQDISVNGAILGRLCSHPLGRRMFGVPSLVHCLLHTAEALRVELGGSADTKYLASAGAVTGGSEGPAPQNTDIRRAPQYASRARRLDTDFAKAPSEEGVALAQAMTAKAQGRGGNVEAAMAQKLAKEVNTALFVYTPKEGLESLAVALVTALWAGFGTLFEPPPARGGEDSDGEAATEPASSVGGSSRRMLRQRGHAHSFGRTALTKGMKSFGATIRGGAAAAEELQPFVPSIIDLLVSMSWSSSNIIAQRAAGALSHLASSKAMTMMMASVPDSLGASDAAQLLARWMGGVTGGMRLAQGSAARTATNERNMRRARDCGIALLTQLLHIGGEGAAFGAVRAGAVDVIKQVAFQQTPGFDPSAPPARDVDAVGGARTLSTKPFMTRVRSPLPDCLCALMHMAYWVNAEDIYGPEAGPALVRACATWLQIPRPSMLCFTLVLLFSLARDQALREEAVAYGCGMHLLRWAEHLSGTVHGLTGAIDAADIVSRRAATRALSLVLGTMWRLVCPVPPDRFVIPPPPPPKAAPAPPADGERPKRPPRRVKTSEGPELNPSGTPVNPPVPEDPRNAVVPSVPVLISVISLPVEVSGVCHHLALEVAWRMLTCSSPYAAAATRYALVRERAPALICDVAVNAGRPDSLRLLGMQVLYELRPTLADGLDAALIAASWAPSNIERVAVSAMHPDETRHVQAYGVHVAAELSCRGGPRDRLVAAGGVETVCALLEQSLARITDHRLTQLWSPLTGAVAVQLSRGGSGEFDDGEGNYDAPGTDDDGSFGLPRSGMEASMAAEAEADLESALVFSHEVVTGMLQCLLNFTLDKRSQGPVGRYSLDLLLHILQQADSMHPQMVDLASKIISNMRHHPENSTRIYKAELMLSYCQSGMEAGEFVNPHAGPAPEARATRMLRRAQEEDSLLQRSREHELSVHTTVPIAGSHDLQKHAVPHEDMSLHGGSLVDFNPTFEEAPPVTVQYMSTKLARKAKSGELRRRLKLLRIGFSEYEKEKVRGPRGPKEFGLPTSSAELLAGAKGGKGGAAKDSGPETPAKGSSRRGSSSSSAAEDDTPGSPVAAAASSTPQGDGRASRLMADGKQPASASKTARTAAGKAAAGELAAAKDLSSTRGTQASELRRTATAETLDVTMPLHVARMAEVMAIFNEGPSPEEFVQSLIPTRPQLEMITRDVRLTLEHKQGSDRVALGQLPQYYFQAPDLDQVHDSFDRLRELLWPGGGGAAVEDQKRFSSQDALRIKSIKEEFTAPYGLGAVFPPSDPRFDVELYIDHRRKAGIPDNFGESTHAKKPLALASYSCAGDRILPAWISAGIHAPKSKEALPIHNLRRRLSRPSSALWTRRSGGTSILPIKQAARTADHVRTASLLQEEERLLAENPGLLQKRQEEAAAQRAAEALAADPDAKYRRMDDDEKPKRVRYNVKRPKSAATLVRASKMQAKSTHNLLALKDGVDGGPSVSSLGSNGTPGGPAKKGRGKPQPLPAKVGQEEMKYVRPAFVAGKSQATEMGFGPLPGAAMDASFSVAKRKQLRHGPGTGPGAASRPKTADALLTGSPLPPGTRLKPSETEGLLALPALAHALPDLSRGHLHDSVWGDGSDLGGPSGGPSMSRSMAEPSPMPPSLIVQEGGIAAVSADGHFAGAVRERATPGVLAYQEAFPHVHGSRFCEGLLEHMELPDGTSVHMSKPRGPVYEMQTPSFTLPRPEPAGLEAIGQTSFPQPQKPVTMLPSDLPPGYVPPVGTNTLPPWCRYNTLYKGHDTGAVMPEVPPDEPAQLVLWRAPPPPPPPPEPEPVEEEGPPPFDLKKSVFAPRLKESQSRDFYDTDRLMKHAFDMDWQRVWGHSGFNRTLVKACGNDNKQIEAVKLLLKVNYQSLSDIFDFFGCRNSSNECFSLLLNSFTEFVLHCKIPDPNEDKESKCKLSDIDRFFIATNVEDKPTNARQREDNKVNMDRALVRFEFLEILVRIALAKYETSMTNPAGMLDALLHEHVMPHCAHLGHDRNSFRRGRLYTREVNTYYKDHMTTVSALHEMYCPNEVGSLKKSTRMPLENFMTFLSESGIFDDTFAIRDARLCFIWARCRTSDELRKRERTNTLTKTDFLDALGRVADMKWMPDDRQLGVAGIRNNNVYRYFAEGWHMAARRKAEAEAAHLKERAAEHWDEVRQLTSVLQEATGMHAEAAGRVGTAHHDDDGSVGTTTPRGPAGDDDGSVVDEGGGSGSESAATESSPKKDAHAEAPMLERITITRFPHLPLEERIAKLLQIVTVTQAVKQLEGTGNYAEARHVAETGRLPTKKPPSQAASSSAASVASQSSG